MPLMNKEQLIILRSTIYPGTTEIIEQKLQKHFNTRPKLAFCPERILQGKGIEEIKNLPQIVSAVSDEAAKEASEIFSEVAPKIIRLEPIEAELSKLMLNTWRYLEFAIANQFYMMVEDKGLDFYKIFEAMKEDYPRAKIIVSPGWRQGLVFLKTQCSFLHFTETSFSGAVCNACQ